MSDEKSTKLNIREDRPTAISSSMQGSNVTALAFNLAFIAMRNPKLAIEIIRLYDESHSIDESDPTAPGEDLDFNDALKNLPIDDK